MEMRDFSQRTRSLSAPGDGENNEDTDGHRIDRWLPVHEPVLWGGTPKNWLKTRPFCIEKGANGRKCRPPLRTTGIRNSETRKRGYGQYGYNRGFSVGPRGVAPVLSLRKTPRKNPPLGSARTEKRRWGQAPPREPEQ